MQRLARDCASICPTRTISSQKPRNIKGKHMGERKPACMLPLASDVHCVSRNRRGMAGHDKYNTIERKSEGV